MKLGASLWGAGLILVIITSATGWLFHVPTVLVSVPAALYGIGAGAFSVGRSGLATPNRILSCAFAFLIALVAYTQFPFRALFLASKGDLELTAGQVAKGGPFSGQTAGWFSLCSSEARADGNICLWTEANDKQRIGFVRTRSPNVIRALREINLGDGWRYVSVKAE